MEEHFSQYRTLSTNNICYKVFHLSGEKNQSRVNCAKKIRSTLELNELTSSTVLIEGLESLKEFISNYPQFKIDPDGYDPFYTRLKLEYSKNNAKPIGWLYQELGIWASSYLAYKEFLNSTYDYLIIFEDDLMIKNNFLSLLDFYMTELPEDWDVFYQYSQLPPLFYGKSVSEHLCTPYTTSSNAAYVVNKNSAKKIIDDIEKEGISLPIDWHLLRQPNRFKSYAIQVGFDKGCDVAKTMSTYAVGPLTRYKLHGLL